MLDPDRGRRHRAGWPPGRAAAHFHACTHTTFSPQPRHGGVKTNVIPDRVEIDVDIRTLPGETAETVPPTCGARSATSWPTGSRSTSLGIAAVDASPAGTPMWDGDGGRRPRATTPTPSCCPA